METKCSAAEIEGVGSFGNAERYERESVLVTTNLDFASRTEVFGAARLTGALLDRLTHSCHIIEFQGDSYRFKESLRRREKTKAKT